MAEGRSSDSRRKGRGSAGKAKVDRTCPLPGSLYAFLRPRVSPARGESDAAVASPEIENDESSLQNAMETEVKSHDSLEESTQVASVGNENENKAVENDFFSPWSKRLRKRNSNVAVAEEPDDPVRSSKKLQKKKESPAKTRKEEVLERDSLSCDYDLRKEARVAAEQYATLSAGKPLHPFFQRNKSAEQLSSEESPICPDSFLDPSSPFHILQDTPNVEPEINWRSFERSSFAPSATEFASSDHGYVLAKEEKSAVPSQRFFSNAATLSNGFAEVNDFLKESGAEHLSVECLKEKYAWYQARNAGLATTTMNPLWTYLYQPHSSKQLCGNRDSVSSLSDWLSQWKQKILSGKLETGDEASELSLDYSDHEIDDDEQWDDALLQNTMLVTGPVGCGKSAAVYACASEHGFKVIEINASESRAGATIKQRFGEASESEALNWSTGGDQASDRKLTMILFEEIDTVFEEDKGFLTAVVQFAKSAKRPMVLTSNRRRPLLPHMRRASIDFIKPTMEDLVVHACLVFASNGLFGDPWIMKRIVGSCHQDVRQLMMLLQFWGQGALSSRSTLEADQHSGMEQIAQEKMILPRTSWWEDLDAEHCCLPELVPLGFPCSQSQLVAGKISEAVQKAEKIATSCAAKAAEDAAFRQAEVLRAARRSKRLAKKAEAELLDNADNIEIVMGVEAKERNGDEAVAMIKTCGAGRPKRLRKLNDIRDKPQAEVEDDLASKDLAEGAEGLVSIVETCATEKSVTAEAEELPSTSNEQVDPVRAQWQDLRKGQRSLLRSNSSSVQTMLSVNDALAAAEEAFSSCDIMSTSPMEESPCIEISQQLTRRILGHLLQECDEALQSSDAACDGKRSAYAPPWHEQHSNKLQTQSYLEERLFLANPKKARHGLTPAAFVDYISYMARTVAIEDDKKAEVLLPRLKRSRGFQEGYLSEKGVSTQGIQALRQHFSFKNSFKH